MFLLQKALKEAKANKIWKDIYLIDNDISSKNDVKVRYYYTSFHCYNLGNFRKMRKVKKQLLLMTLEKLWYVLK